MSVAPAVAVPRARFNWLPIQIALFCLIWSFAFVAGKIGVTDCPPLILLAARFLLAGFIIAVISALRGETFDLSPRDVAVFSLIGIANNALYLGLGYTGLQTVSAGIGGLVVSANPVFTAALAALFLGEVMTWRKAFGLLLGVAGVTFIVWHRLSVGADHIEGMLFTLASLASIVAGTILYKLLAPKGSLWIGNGIQNLSGGIVLVPFAAAFADVHAIVPSMRLFGAFAFLVLAGSILAYLLWFHLLKVCGATAASAYHFLMPPLGMLFAFLVLGEIDAVLLSHDQHSDNLDNSGRDFLQKAKRVLTTEAGAKRLGGHAEGFAPWASTVLKGRNGHSLTITATPARHGPAGIEPLSGDVIGFVVASSNAALRPIYISGDTTWFDGVAEVAKRFNAGIVLPFAGAAQTRGPFHLTMDTNDTIETARAFADALIVPVHTDGWAHFKQNAQDLRVSFDALGFGKRLRLLEPGVKTEIV